MKKRNILIIVLLIILILWISGMIANNTNSTLKAVVVKVHNNSLLVMGTENSSSLYTVGFKGDVSYKQGQEILIYFDGTVMESYPAQLGNVSKIKIIKEKSNTEIPKDVLRYAYSSKEKVAVSVNELTTKGISITITDKNDLPYEYTNNYAIYKKVKNENYTGVGQKIGEDTKYSTSGYTRNRNRVYLGRVREKL